MDQELTARLKGLFMVVIGAAFWGISGTVAQQLFQHDGVEVGWLVTVRLLCTGLVLLILSSFGGSKKKVWRVWKTPQQAVQLLIFGIVGLLGVQYTYFASIKLGNAAVATLLQYLAPLFILIYLMWKNRQAPKFIDVCSIILALLGTYLLLTNGCGLKLHLPPFAVIWGILSGVALAFYTLYPGSLLKTWGSTIVIGWGMVIGGIGLSFIHPPWQIGAVHWSFLTVASLFFVILFGTLLAFYLYLESLTYLSPKETSLLACVEPLTSVITAVTWLGVSMRLWQYVGAGFVIIMIILQAVNRPEKKKKKASPQNTYKAM